MDSFTTTMNLGQASLNLRGMWLPRRSLPSYSRMLTMPAIQMPCGPLAENSKSEDGNTAKPYRDGHTSSRLAGFQADPNIDATASLRAAAPRSSSTLPGLQAVAAANPVVQTAVGIPHNAAAFLKTLGATVAGIPDTVADILLTPTEQATKVIGEFSGPKYYPGYYFWQLPAATAREAIEENPASQWIHTAGGAGVTDCCSTSSWTPEGSPIDRSTTATAPPGPRPITAFGTRPCARVVTRNEIHF